MTTIITDTYYNADLSPATGEAQVWVPVDRPAVAGGHIAPAVTKSPIVNGKLSITVDPGLLYVRIVLSGATYPVTLYSIPNVSTVVLGTLTPVIPTPPAPLPTTTDGGTL